MATAPSQPRRRSQAPARPRRSSAQAQRDAAVPTQARPRPRSTRCAAQRLPTAQHRAPRRPRSRRLQRSRPGRARRHRVAPGRADRQLSERLRGRRDPADMVQALDSAHPVMLLPVAVQTRYDDATTQLMIRIYPDAIRTASAHEPGLGDERGRGRQDATGRSASPSPATPTRRGQQIARIYRPSRAAWIVRTTTPTNVAAIGSAPNGEPMRRRSTTPRSRCADPTAPTIYATALPDRFVAIGQAGGKEIFRKWGAPVADLLAMSPAFDPLLVDDPDNTRSVRRRPRLDGRLSGGDRRRHGDHHHRRPT